MNIVGYLVTMANLQNLGSGPLKDISVRVADVETLANQFNAMPQFNVKSFRETGYYRNGDIGMYVSDNIINYLTNGNANPKDGGLIVTFYYDSASAKSFTGVGGDIALISTAFNSGVKEYFDSEKISERNKRSMEPTSFDVLKNNKLSENINKYFDGKRIFGRPQSNQGPSDDKSIAQLKANIINDEKQLVKEFKKLFEDRKIFGRYQQHLSDPMNKVNSANGNNL